MTSHTVETVPLDEMDLPPIGFIKIDVEGHELDVLRGARETIRKNQPKLLIEIEDRHNPGGVEAARALLREWDYEGQVYLGDELQSLSRFKPAVHQNPSNIDAAGHRLGLYVNNFLFSPAAAIG